MPEDISRGNPEADHCQSLVAPREITPKHIEIQLGQKRTRSKKRQRDYQSVPYGFLVQPGHLAENQSCTAECGVSGCDRTGDDTHDGKDSADQSEHAGTDFIDHSRLPQRGKHLVEFSGISIEGHTACSPDKSDDGFGKHGPVEDFTPNFFTDNAL